MRGRIRTSLLRITDELDHVKDGFDDGPLEIISSLVPQHSTQERKHDALLARELEAQGPDGIDDDDLELVRDLRHER